ncbi:MAG: glycosyltransferase family 4 protein [Ardenticatenales bacterium]|nr:glycosyltransferase family 4 protein [Ardenticatenales bacterium]
MMMPKALYAAFDLVPSPKGASTHITYFTRGLVKAGYKMSLITAGDPNLPLQECYEGANLWRVPSTGDQNFLRRAGVYGQFVLAHLQERADYEIVHVRSIWAGFPLVSHFGAARPFKLLYEVNGLPSIEMKYHYEALEGSPLLDKLREQEAATLHAADAIICPSRVTADYIASLRVPREKITVIPNGVDTSLYHPGPAPAAAAYTLLYTGTLADWQGLDVLVAALPLVEADRPVQLKLIGRGRKRQRKALQKQARRLGVEEQLLIEPPIPHEQLPALIRQADLCVAPLGFNDRNVTQGCCPLKVLEYMACGRPTVAANLPVVREIAYADEEIQLFLPEDPVDLARQISQLLAEPERAAAMGRKAAARVRAEMGWDRAVEQLLAVYANLSG